MIEVVDIEKKVKVVEVNEEIVNAFEYDGVEIGFATKVDIKKVINYYAQIGTAYAAIFNGRVVAIGGITPVWYGVGFAWLFLNREAKRCIKSIYKTIKEVLSNALKNGFHRIHTHCLDLSETKRLLEHLGFKKEGVMRKFGEDGEDMIMYAILKEE